MRVFAGPNGSGKSTVIKSVRDYKTGNRKLDFGIYVNADDIVVNLKKNKFKFANYEIKTTAEEFRDIALQSGLIDRDFTQKQFSDSFRLDRGKIVIKNINHLDRLGQITADFLRKKLLAESKKFSFETVFSHPSKISIMHEAIDKGYKIYLYFVSTSSPEINKERVKLRVKEGGHNVPESKITSRYFRSLDLMYDAAQLSYQTFFWDNSHDQPKLFTNFKMVSGKKEWKKITQKDAPDWFIKYYANKVKLK